MTPIEIAKKALDEIIRKGGVDAVMIAINALTEIAIEEQNEKPPHRPIAPAIIKRMFTGRHG